MPNGCIGAGDTGFFCKYVVQYLTEAGFSTEQINRGGYTIKTTLDRNAMRQVKNSVDRVAPDAPNVANAMALVQPGQNRHRVLAMGANRTFGLDADSEETSYGLPYQPVNLGAGSVYKIFTAATALEKGLGINYQMDVPPSGYASPIYLDGGARPIPVANAGNYPPRAVDDRRAGARRRTPRSSSWRSTPASRTSSTCRCGSGMKSLATTPFTDPNTGQRDRQVDRRR